MMDIKSFSDPAICNQPKTEMTPVVRCKDCRFYTFIDYAKSFGCANRLGMFEWADSGDQADMDFCSRGELREPEQPVKFSDKAKMKVFDKEINIPCEYIEEKYEGHFQDGDHYRFLINGVPNQFVALLLAFGVGLRDLRCSVYEQPEGVYECQADYNRSGCCQLVENDCHHVKIIND